MREFASPPTDVLGGVSTRIVYSEDGLGMHRRSNQTRWQSVCARRAGLNTRRLEEGLRHGIRGPPAHGRPRGSASQRGCGCCCFELCTTRENEVVSLLRATAAAAHRRRRRVRGFLADVAGKPRRRGRARIQRPSRRACVLRAHRGNEQHVPPSPVARPSVELQRALCVFARSKLAVLRILPTPVAGCNRSTRTCVGCARPRP